METNELIKKRRLELGLTLKDVAESLGVAESTVSRYESKDIENMGIDKIKQLAKVLKCTPSYLMGWDSNVIPIEYSSEKFASINIYGTVPAGVPIEAVENIIGKTEIPAEWLSGDKKYIGLEVKGDSMYPKYFEGDIIIVKLQNDCESGQDAVIYVNGYDATLKTVVKDESNIILRPYNREYPEKKYYKKDGEITILGVVKELRRNVCC